MEQGSGISVSAALMQRWASRRSLVLLGARNGVAILGIKGTTQGEAIT